MSEAVPGEAVPAPPKHAGPMKGVKKLTKAAQLQIMDTRRKRVAELMLMRYTKNEIAEQLGIHRNTIQTDMNAVRALWREETTKSHQAWVDEELRSLDQDERRLLALYGRAQQKLTPEEAKGLPRMVVLEDDRASSAAAAVVWDRVLKCRERRAKLLGLDKPQQIQTQQVIHAQVDVVSQARAALQDPAAIELLMQFQDKVAKLLPPPIDTIITTITAVPETAVEPNKPDEGVSLEV